MEPKVRTAAENVHVAWKTLERELTRALSLMGDGEWQYLILSDQRAWRYVQFAVQAESAIRAEAVSNNYLPPPHRLSEMENAALEKLGWTSPEAAPTSDEPTPEKVNYFRDFQRPTNFAEVAALAVSTLRDVFQVPFPARLEYDAFEKGGKAIIVPTLEIVRRRPKPAPKEAAQDDSIGAVRAKVLAAVRKAADNPDIEPDDEGDINVRFNSALVIVRVHDKPSYVSVFSPVLAKVQASEQVVQRLNEMNAKVRFARLFQIDGSIYAAVEVCTSPLVVEHVVHACRVLGELADDIDDMLQAEFGGRTAFGEFRAKSLKN